MTFLEAFKVPRYVERIKCFLLREDLRGDMILLYKMFTGVDNLETFKLGKNIGQKKRGL